tara:strand:+ start:1281 stop:1874 length:594 start_codon:yes stop_codon:yes gene_type:complete
MPLFKPFLTSRYATECVQLPDALAPTARHSICFVHRQAPGQLWPTFKYNLARHFSRRLGVDPLGFAGARTVAWPPPLAVPAALDALAADAVPPDFVCALTYAIMRQPAITPHGTTYEYDAVAGWADQNSRYPATECGEPLHRSQLTPNRVLRSMIEDWIATQSSSNYRRARSPLPRPQPATQATRRHRGARDATGVH